MKQTRYLVVILLAMLLVAFSGCSSKKVKDGTGGPGSTPGISDAAANSGTGEGGVDGEGGANGEGASGNSADAPRERVVYFDYDKSDIRGDARSVLESHAAYLTAHPTTIRLEGHADERGSREYNLALGERRAETAKRALSILGVPDSQINTLSYGEERPIDPGHNETAWQLNRRVEIIYP